MHRPPEAELKHFGRIAAWVWRRNGVLTLELTGEGVLSDAQTDSLGGEHLDDSYFDLILEEDADVYKPGGNDLFSMFAEESDPEDRLLVSFRKGVFSQETRKGVREALRSAAALADNRGMAGGKVDPKKLRTIAQQGEIELIGSGVRARYKLPDGSFAKTTAANKVASGIAGNFDASPRFPFCRQTSWTRAHPEQSAAAVPFLEAISEQFRKQAPSRWQKQRDFLDEHDVPAKGWQLGESVFTTMTVNRNWQTAVHKDAGDFPHGFGNLTVFEGSPYSGGATGFPKYRVAVRVLEGDFLAMDVHEWHGNTPMSPTTPPPDGEEWGDPDGENAGYERISLVCYTRANIGSCRNISEEEAAMAAWKAGFKSPKKLQAEQLQRNAEEHEAAIDQLQTFEELLLESEKP